VRRVPPAYWLCALVALSAATLVAKSGLALSLLSLPVSSWLFVRRRTRALLVRRWLLIAPLVGLAAVLHWLDPAPSERPWTPLLRACGALAWSTWLTAELSPRELDAALRTLRVPDALVDLIAQTRRFSGQLAQTSSEALNAAVLRGGLLTARTSARTAGLVAGVIVVRAFDRAESVAVAVALRGAPCDEPLTGSRALEAMEHG
jgi:energy-coupling factor transporter transmembrane protein EcfT